MPDIMTRVDRLRELSDLLLQMTHECDTKKFWELNRQFEDIVALNRLEDELNDSNDTGTL